MASIQDPILDIPTHQPSPSPSPAPAPRPVRKLSQTAHTAISAGESAFHALTSQVGGHPGVLASEDNALIVKASLYHERVFYELLAQEDMALARLQPFVPKFYGTLKLEGQIATEKGLEPAGGVAAISAAVGDDTSGIIPLPKTEGKDERAPFSIVLENISSVFTKPNIMDIKLGTVLYEENASLEKQERMLETARTTTSLETGIRLTGFQVYDHTVGEAVVTPKTYGKSIKASDLPDGIRRFFPVSPSPADSAAPSGQGLPRDMLLLILHGLLDDIKAVRDALAATELRMVGGSLLIVYEADWAVARQALEKEAAERTNSAGLSAEANVGDEEGYDSDIESDEEEVPAYVVKLIDFAHTRLTPGEGADEGVLKGVETTIRLFEGRIKELEDEY